MTSKEQISALFCKYINIFPEEKNITLHFQKFVNCFDTEQLYNRKNFAGHITASAIIADHDMERFLLLEHKQLKKWLQPGGHIEPADGDLLRSALREVEEETGLTADQLEIMSTAEGLFVIDMDSHYIPASELKSEAEHYHHDIRFLFRLKGGDISVNLDTTESDGYKWVTRGEFPDYFGIIRTMSKIDGFVMAYDGSLADTLMTGL